MLIKTGNEKLQVKISVWRMAMSKGLETQLVRECAPTLAGIKTANLFNYKYSSREEFMQELAEANKHILYLRAGSGLIRTIPTPWFHHTPSYNH